MTNGVITFDTLIVSVCALSLTSLSNVATAVDYLQANDIGNAGQTVAFVATISVLLTRIFTSRLERPNPRQTIYLIDLIGSDVGESLYPDRWTTVKPAGVAGSPINLGLTDVTVEQGQVALTIVGTPADWVINGATLNSDGTWTVTTNDVASLTVTTPATYSGAAVLNVTETWTAADGTVHVTTIADNVEAYAPGTPIFAWSGDDTLTGSTAADLFVVGSPTGHVTVHSFDAAADRVDLVGFAGLMDFAGLQGHLADDGDGNATVTLGDGQSVTLHGVHTSSLTADNFEFDQAPAWSNAGTMTIDDGALLPVSGMLTNAGTIALNSAGIETSLEIIQHGLVLEGHGLVVLSDDAQNLIYGSTGDVTLTNVDNTISGAGQVGAGQMTLVNGGTIVATGSNALVIDTGDNAISNSGTLAATGSGGLEINSDVLNTGLLWANGATLAVHGTVSGNGSAQISDAGTLEFGAAASAHTVFDASAAGTLQLDASFDFSGLVSGFNHDDHLDLRDIAFGAGTTVGYTANADGSGGTLSISDGAHMANIGLVGQYDASGFAAGSDGLTGTLVSYRPDHLV